MRLKRKRITNTQQIKSPKSNIFVSRGSKQSLNMLKHWRVIGFSEYIVVVYLKCLGGKGGVSRTAESKVYDFGMLNMHLAGQQTHCFGDD